ncbi:MAG: DUF1295 domain-containing protein [Planctomycetota bacterium]
MASQPTPVAVLPPGSEGLALPLLGGLVVLFVALWAVARAQRNAAWVDVGWSGALGLLALVYAVLGSALGTRRILLAAVVGPWSARLVLHLVRDRILPGVEEGRYQALRAWLGRRAELVFLGVFVAQAGLALALSLPFALVAWNPLPALHPLEIVGAVGALGAWAGEAMADRQLAAFKARPRTSGTVCREGLWGWSRHPNYFFEWLVWCGFALMATPAPGGWVAWGAPLLMLLLVLFVTGIPPTERRALASRGAAYRRYQREVSAFVPWPPRATSES